MGMSYAQACKAVSQEPDLATSVGMAPEVVRQAVADLEDPWARALYEAERQVIDPEHKRAPTVTDDRMSLNQLRLLLEQMAQDPDLGPLPVVLGSGLQPLKLVTVGVLRCAPTSDEDYCVVLSP